MAATVIAAGCQPAPSGGDGTVATAYQVNAGHSGSSATLLSPQASHRWTRVFPEGRPSYALIIGDRVYVTVRYDRRDSSGASHLSFVLLALDRRSGRTQWTKNIGTPLDYNFVGLTYARGRLFTVTDYAVRGFDASTGRSLWTRVSPGGDANIAPPTARGEVLAVHNRAIVLLDPETGEPVAGLDAIQSSRRGTPALSPRGAYIGGPFGHVYGRPTAPGGPSWHRKGEQIGGGGSTPVAYRDRLYYLDRNGPDLVLDLRTGEELGTFESAFHPAFVGETGYYVAATGGIEARDVRTQRVLWRRLVTPTTAPVVAGQVVAIGSGTSVKTFDRATGAPLRSYDIGATVETREFGFAGPVSGLNVAERTLVVSADDRIAAFS
jgi:outer membrane protein assembly factor BamB